ncbi:MAG: lytic transglycosylase F [Bacteroidetes bacterium]|nr:MAG: lytic transglycosylase F [Bacteroidota bacterium]MBL1146046.1 lytic transglycosylase F [Bacteroidota bacterium]MCB0803987.1 transporter substrate-binding domain-containing protein [Flavobacteriales bacterium]NOG58840.1 transporter substrate-binding domain-containing protein [Bacteroidota bacterium]
MKLNKYLSLIFCCLYLLFACQPTETENASKLKEKTAFDLDSIRKRGKLIALVDNSSTSYFVYKGKPMGFEYDLLTKFADYIDLELEVKFISNLDSVANELFLKKADIIAANLTVTKERKKFLSFSNQILASKQVLVQQLNKSRKLIESPSELIDSTIYVRKASSFYQRLVHLSEEIGGNLKIKTVPGNVTVEQLIKKVNDGEIAFTVADEHVAKINKAFYRNIDIKTAISLEQKLAWAVRPKSKVLLDSINNWLNKYKHTLEFRMFYLKYFGNTQLYRSRLNSELFTPKSGTLSPYDDAIKEYSSFIKWDWRLVTSLIYQESGFDPNSNSWTGASGLMQLMPNTAESYGIDSLSDPEDNIEAGIQYISWLDKQFVEKVTDSTERIKFILAAYNVGLGHVFDAMRLAEKYHLNPQIWEDNVAEMLKNKSIPEYYKDEVVYYGYCRGSEPYDYVKEILDRFEHYKNITSSTNNKLTE